MLIDALALGLAAFASWLATRPVSFRHSYGLVRAEVVAALVNSVLMLALLVFIVWEAIAASACAEAVNGAVVMVHRSGRPRRQHGSLPTSCRAPNRR